MRTTPLAALCAALLLLGCEPEVAPEVCGSLTVISRADVDAARDCTEIQGNLSLQGGAAEITASDFPKLTRISGDLTVSSFQNREPRLTQLTLGALESVGGKLQIAANSSLVTASFPALTTVGAAGADGMLDVSFSILRRLDLPALTTVHGSVQLGDMDAFCSVTMRRVSRVTGEVGIRNLPNVPFSALRALYDSAPGRATAAEVGCCYPPDASGCTLDWSPSCTSSACL